MIIEHNLTENEEKEILNKGKNEISKLNWLTKSLVQISRLETGMIILDLKDRDIKNTIINAVNSIYLKLKEKDISIQFDSFFSCSIKHDSKWTEEAICNILENSIKYTDPHGSIKISMTKSEIATNIIIEDTGIGIHKDELTKIFNRFYRGKSERVQNSEGSGIGLYLTKWIIENQGGAIRVKSEPNKGTCFTILFFQGDNQ
jgi:signal transduction histidine kinase